MPRHTPEANAKCGRSKLSNRPTWLPGVMDARSTWGRRRRDLIREFTAELGHEPSTREAVMISNAAALVTRCEQITVQVMNNEDVDDGQFARLSSMATRLLQALDIAQRTSAKAQAAKPKVRKVALRKPITERPNDLHAYLAARGVE